MSIFADSGPILLALTVGIFAPLSGWAAIRRARNPVIWFAIGAFSGPAALFILAISPPGRCPSCDRPVPGWNRVCARCGTTFPPIWEEEPATAFTVSAAGAAARSDADRAAPGGTVVAPSAAAATAPARGRGRSSRTAPVPEIAPTGAAPASPAASTSPAATASNGTRRKATRSAAAARSAAPAEPVVEPVVETPAGPVTPPPVQRVFEPPRPPRQEPPRIEPAATAHDEVRVLATGIYILGNAGLEVGARYGLARVGDRLRVFGPVDLGAVTVRHERPLADLEVTGMGEQLIISMTTRGSGLAMVFQGLGGMQPAELERVLAGPEAGDGRSGVVPT